jgi:dienelactone hydrolase
VTYDATAGMTDGFASLVPRYLRIAHEVPAYRDVPVSGTGPFPVVVFSHGYGSWRTLNATLLAQIASWGFVVASTDKPDQTFQAVYLGHPPDWDADVDAALLSATLDRMVEEGKAHGALAGAVDAGHVGVIGYSSGGADAYRVLQKDKRFDVGVVWNYSVAGDVGRKPLMIIATDGDLLSPHVDADFRRLKGPSRLVQVANSGHMVTTDVCDGLMSPDGLLTRIQNVHLALPKAIDDVVRDGCEPGDLAVDKGQAVFLHFTVAELRDALGLGSSGAGLGEDVVADLPALVVYHQRHIG